MNRLFFILSFLMGAIVLGSNYLVQFPVKYYGLEKILIKEKLDAILPTMGGQTALNLAIKAEKIGLLKKYKNIFKR